MTERLAYIGTGIMGAPMAGHLLAAGYPLTVHNRTKAKAQPLIDKGATWAEDPALAAEQADVIFTNVTDTPDVEAIVLGHRGVLSVARPGMIVVDHSTISPAATREMAAKLAEQGATLLDAPVSGGDVGARNATLAIMVGGDAPALERVRPMLQRMGKSITHCGPVGTGQLTKLANQIFVAVTNLAVCEGLNFAKANGLDLQKTIDAVKEGAAGSWQLVTLGPRMIKGDFAPGFMIDLQVKDLNLVLDAAHSAGLYLAATQQADALFTDAQQAGRGRDGTQRLFDMVEKHARAFHQLAHQEAGDVDAGE
jgi:3-hydroxyisobutyrate dehydrogenase